MFSRLRHFLLLACAVMLAGCSKKADPAASARTFFEQIAAGNAADAYESATYGFKAQQTGQFFEQTAKELELASFASMTSEPPETERNSAKLKIEMTTKSGKKIPLIVTLVDERGEWRVHAIRSPKSLETGLSANLFGTVGKGTAFVDALNRPMPETQEVNKLIETHLMMFDAAIQEKSFDNFYDRVSRAWQAQLTKGQLTREFQPFIDKKISLAGIRGMEPVLDGPTTLTTDGLVIAKGYYDTKPYRVHFLLKFVYELPKWRLFGLDVSITAVQAAK